MSIAHLDTPVGTLEIVSGPDGLTALRFDPLEAPDAAPPPELVAYFQGDLRAIDALAVHARGTPFQESVWAALRMIPVGSTISYGELARRIGIMEEVLWVQILSLAPLTPHILAII